MTWVTPSPESKTIPVDFPVANLHRKRFTKRELPEQPHKRLGLGTFRKRFQAFFFYVWWDSCWLRSGGLGIRWGQSWGAKMHVSKAIPCHPSNRWLRAKWDIWVYRAHACWYWVIIRRRCQAGWQYWGLQLGTLALPLYLLVDVHGGEHVWPFLLATEAHLHQSASLAKSRSTLSITTGDLRNESIIYRLLDLNELDLSINWKNKWGNRDGSLVRKYKFAL